jgi:hypothetical protein
VQDRVESRSESKAIVLRSAADGARAARDEQQCRQITWVMRLHRWNRQVRNK